MSTRYPGGIITKTPVVPTGPYENGTAPGIWTLEQQLQAQKTGIWPTAGLQPNYIEDVFSTYLYTGNGSTQTITNGIDLSGKGGLTWIKGRTQAFNHTLVDTVRGATNLLVSNTTAAQATQANSLTAFTSTGFSIGAGSIVNFSADNFASWTFREQPKFFDVVTWTGDGVPGRTISHNLGSVPGCIIVKRLNGVADWSVYHRSLPVRTSTTTDILFLDLTDAASTSSDFQGSSQPPTSTGFSVGSTSRVNGSGDTYVAYLFAHDAGGFGLTGTDNVISCGSLTMGSGITTATLGYEPQWLLIKGSNNANEWWLIDNMRGLSQANYARLFANSAATESVSSGPYILPTATGFTMDGSIFGSGNSFIYIAIRRGPMKVPTSGTSVFSPILQSPQSAGTVRTVGFPADLVIGNIRSGSGHYFQDRLRGFPSSGTTQNTLSVQSQSTAAEASAYPYFYDVWNTTAKDGDLAFMTNGVGWTFGRAPGFFDEVCYTGTGSATTFNHNLGVVPELMIMKRRSGAGNWPVYSAASGPSAGPAINSRSGAYWGGSSNLNSTAPTSSVFTVGTDTDTNSSGSTYVAYLFATCAGVSKVGSYTGNGTTQTIDCGFGAGGVRFVLIKRTDVDGDWYVYDTARGMTVLTDPYLFLNSTAAEVATLGSVTTVSTGFALNSAILAAINVNAGTYIFLAIA